jgi:ArsR family transcriptional regulator
MNDAALAKIFKALSNEPRLRIFRLLCGWQDAQAAKRAGEECCGVEKGFTRACCSSELSPSTISHHFKELQGAGLITVERTGQSFVCTVKGEALDAVRDFLKVAPRK